MSVKLHYIFQRMFHIIPNLCKHNQILHRRTTLEIYLNELLLYAPVSNRHPTTTVTWWRIMEMVQTGEESSIHISIPGCRRRGNLNLRGQRLSITVVLHWLLTFSREVSYQP